MKNFYVIGPALFIKLCIGELNKFSNPISFYGGVSNTEISGSFPYKLIVSLNFTACLRLTSTFSPPLISSNKPPLK